MYVFFFSFCCILSCIQIEPTFPPLHMILDKMVFFTGKMGLFFFYAYYLGKIDRQVFIVPSVQALLARKGPL